MLVYKGKIGKINRGENNKGNVIPPQEKKDGTMSKEVTWGQLQFFNSETFKIEIVKLNYNLGQDYSDLKAGDIIQVEVEGVYHEKKKEVEYKVIGEISKK